MHILKVLRINSRAQPDPTRGPDPHLRRQITRTDPRWPATPRARPHSQPQRALTPPPQPKPGWPRHRPHCRRSRRRIPPLILDLAPTAIIQLGLPESHPHHRRTTALPAVLIARTLHSTGNLHTNQNLCLFTISIFSFRSANNTVFLLASTHPSSESETHKMTRRPQETSIFTGSRALHPFLFCFRAVFR